MAWKTVVVAALAALTICGVAQGDTTLRFSPAADTRVDSSQPTTSFGTSSSLSGDASPTIRSFLRFSVYGVTGRPFAAAGLRMRNVNSSSHGGRVSSMSSQSWSESVTWESQPAIDGPQVGVFDAVLAGRDYLTALPEAVAVDGPVDLGLDSPSDDGAGWASRESSTPPELAITLAEDTGLSQPAGPRVGSSDPTYFASNHRLAVTSGGRVLAVHGRHADGVQLAWRDAGSDWRNATRGTTAEGRLLSGTGTGDWPASIVVGRDSAGAEHAWVVWSGVTNWGLRPVQMARLTDLDSPDGPLVEQITTVDSAPQGAYRADVAVETLPSGEEQGRLLWSRRVESGNYEIVTSTFDLADRTPAPTVPHALLSATSNRRYGTLVDTPNGIRAAIRGSSGRLQLHGRVDGAWKTLGSGATTASDGPLDAPSAAALPNGDVLVASALDAGAGTIAVQGFSPGSTTATTQLQLTGYSEPTVVADGDRAWLVCIRRSDGSVVSRELGPDGWSLTDRTELQAGGNHQWPGALAADGRLRLLVRGPAGSAYRSAVLAFERKR